VIGDFDLVVYCCLCQCHVYLLGWTVHALGALNVRNACELGKGLEVFVCLLDEVCSIH